MRYMLSIYGAPYTSQAPQTALNFAEAAIEAGHTIPLIFFYRQSVLIASSLACTPSGEEGLRQGWINFAKQHKTELLICSSAAMRYGLFDEREAKRMKKEHWALNSPFSLAGLGQCIAGLTTTDRMIVFGD